MSQAVAMGEGSAATMELALTKHVGAVRRSLDVVEVEGPDAISFLDGQLSQEIAALAPGMSTWSFVLQPQGKVVALVRVTVRDAEHVILDTDPGFGTLVHDRLNRFCLRVKAELVSREVEVISIRGLGTESVDPPEGAIPSLWQDWPGWDVLEGSELPEGATECSQEAWEAVRIQSGLPKNGADIDERTIPAESGLVPIAASLTKGCYVGQELVARIDSRGHVNRHLRRLTIEGEVPPPGAGLWGGGQDKQVGAITSVTMSALTGHPVALGYVRREVEPGGVLAVRWDQSEAKATLHA